MKNNHKCTFKRENFNYTSRWVQEEPEQWMHSHCPPPDNPFEMHLDHSMSWAFMHNRLSDINPIHKKSDFRIKWTSCSPDSQRAQRELVWWLPHTAFSDQYHHKRRLKFVFLCLRATALSRTALVDHERNTNLQEALLNTLLTSPVKLLPFKVQVTYSCFSNTSEPFSCSNRHPQGNKSTWQTCGRI